MTCAASMNVCIHQQLKCEPDEMKSSLCSPKIDIKSGLFAYDRRSFSLHEKRFTSGHKFIQICRQGEEMGYCIQWKDVVVLLQYPIIIH